MSDYTGIHGRSPWEDVGRDNHFVPEGWEELDIGICPGCGRVVEWDEDREEWEPVPDGVVLVLTAEDAEELVDRLKASQDPGGPSGLDSLIRLEIDLNKPYAQSD